MDCYLVVTTNGPLPDIPDRFKDSHVKLSAPSAPSACVVGDRSATTKEIAELFGFQVGSGEYLGVVVKLEYYSGSESTEIVNRLQELEKKS